MNTDSPHSTEEVWKLLSERLRGFLRSKLPDDSTADDLLQDTFVRIHRNLDRLAENDRLESWVFRIARNVVHDYYRARSRTITTTGEAEPPAESPAGNNLNNTVGHWLVQAIERLPPSYREVLRLYELEGLAQQEIADRLQLSLSATKSRVRRGRDLLRAELDQSCRIERDRRGNVIDCSQRAEGSCTNSC